MRREVHYATGRTGKKELTIDQCRALIYTVVELDEPKAKEILIFVFWEQVDLLFRAFHTPEVIPVG